MSELCQIKASAGSGKTYELTRNYIVRLTSCANLRKRGSPACMLSPRLMACASGEILAVTFTNAAAAEMRQRVISRLKTAALAQKTDEMLPAEAARAWLATLLRDMSSLNIRTIDSLLYLIVRSSALELGLNPDFRPVFTNTEAIAPYLEVLLEQARHDGPMRKLLRKACMTARDGGAKGFLAGGKLSRRLHAVLADVLMDKFKDLSDEAEIYAALEELRNNVVAAAGDFLQIAGDSGLEFNKRALKAIEDQSRGEFADNLSAYLQKNHAQEVFNKKPLVPEEIEEAYAEYSGLARQFYKQKGMLEKAAAMLPFIELARVVVHAFMQNLEAEGILPNSLVPSLASSVLLSENGVPDVLCRLGTRLTHFLVDEFQDTSREQWRVLHCLSHEALARGGSLTWVGDVKQSIYGWRSGDPALFDEVLNEKDLRAVVPEPDCRSLDTNWRSRRQIVEHTNMIFGPLANEEYARQALAALMPADAPSDILDMAGARLAASFADVAQKCADSSDSGGFVHAESAAGENSEEINQNVLERLCDLLTADIGRRHPWSDVLVLVRGNELARQTAEALIDSGIPVITENSLLLAEHPLVIQTSALLSFLDNPEDNLAFWTVATGSIFLEHPCAAGLTRERLQEWAAQGLAGPLYKKFAQDFPAAWKNLLAPFYSHASLMTPYDIVMEWYARLNVQPRFPRETTFLRRFLEVLQRAEEKGLASIPSFMEYWTEKGGEQKAPMPEHMNAVRIMTIHKAKGLEAPVVIAPWTNFSIRPSGATVVQQCGKLRVAVQLNGKDAGRPYYEDMARQAIESINLLYVALTRPRDELYFFCGVSEGNASGKKSLDAALAMLFDINGLKLPYTLGSRSQGQTMPEAEFPDAEREDSLTANDSWPQEASPDWKPMQWLPGLKIFRNRLGARRLTPDERGIFLHFCLQRLRCGNNPEDAARRALDFGLRYGGIAVPEDQELRAGLLSALSWFASQPCSAQWLEHGWPEQSLAAENGDLLRPDLIVPQKDGVLVIDYKSGKPHDKYIRQARRYLACIKKSGQFSGNIRGLLVYLDEKRFQKVTETEIWPLSGRYDPFNQ